MSKVVKTAAIVVGAVALVATGVGAAIGGGALITGGLTIGTVATVANAAAGALSVVSSLTASKPSATVSGSQTSFSANPDDALPLMIGRTGTAGKITYKVGFDTRDAGDNDRQSFVVTLSVGPIDAIESQTVDQALVTYAGTGAALGAYAGWMWSRTQLGATPEAAALGFGAGAGSPPGWTAQHRLSGKAAATWTLRFDTKGKMFQGGVPAPMWIGRGIRCYDPTKDSTYPGGSGPHRMADPADRAAYDAAQDTWTFTEDPYLIGLRWAHGIWQRDRSNPNSVYERVMGIGAPWAMIDVASFVEGRNIATANGWKAGGIIYSTDGKWDTMKRILQAGMGEPLALGARISCLVNTPKVSLATITIDDVVGAASVAGTQSRRDRINTITPRYRLEANNWQFLPGPPISVPKHVAEDQGKRSRLQDYQFIQNTPQVATAVRYDIENTREFGPIVLPLKLFWMGYKPGDCVTATLPEVGLNAQPILLLNRDLSPAGGIVTMTARSETVEKHPFALGQTTTPPATPGVTGAPLVPVPKDGEWSLSALPGDGARVTPSLLITGTAAANIDGIIFEYRAFDTNAAWISGGTGGSTTTAHEITGFPAPGVYEAAVSYVRNGNVGDRRVIGPVTVGTPAISWGNVTDPNGTRPDDNATVGAPDGTDVGGVPAEQVVDRIAQAKARLDVLDNETIPAVQAAGAAAGQRITEARAAADLALETIESEVERVDLRIDNLSASGGYDDTAVNARITDERELSLGRDAALGTRVDTVSASVTTTDTNLRALVTTKEQAAVNRENAISQRVDQLIAEGGGGSEGVDTIARSEIQRVEQAAVAGQQALATRTTTLESQASPSGGNLVPNTALSTLDGWALTHNPSPNGVVGTMTRNGAGATYMIGTVENNLTLRRPQPFAGFALEASSTRFAVRPGSSIQFYSYVASHRSKGWVSLYFFGSDGAIVGYAGENLATRYDEGGPNIAAHEIVGRTAEPVPANATSACLLLRQYDAGVDAYTWFSRPFVTEVKPGTNTWVPYSPGNDRPVNNATSARIQSTENTLADLPNRYATAQRATNIETAVGAVGGRVGAVETVTSNGTFATAARAEEIASYAGGVGARVDLQAGTIAGLGQKAVAYVRVIADAGSGRALFSLWSDEFGGKWALGGDGLIDGNLTVNGTIKARAFDGASMAREAASTWAGSITPDMGQTISVPWSIVLPPIPPTGRFIYEMTVEITTNAGVREFAGYDGSRRIYNNYVSDGGLTVRAVDAQGNSYAPRPNASDRVLATTDFTPSFSASVKRGSEYRTQDGGDFVNVFISATYTLTRISLKVTWVAI